MEIHAIKQQLPLSQVLGHYGLKPDKNERLCCPFHPDKTPSLQVYPKTDTCYCFSTNCPTHGKSLDVVDFIMHKEKLDKHQAIKKAETLLTTNEGEQLGRTAVLTKIFGYFHKGIYNSKPALDYLGIRHLDKDKLQVGYNSGQFHHRENKHLIESAVKYGLLTANPSGGYFVWGKHCIIFPLKNSENQITGLYGRSIHGNKESRHFYLKDRQGLYPSHPKKETQILILTESIIDAATLLQQELKGFELLALYGTNALTEEHLKAIQALPELEEIVFFLNGDQPGREAVKKHGQTLKTLLPKVKLSNIELPEGEDTNSLLDGHETTIFIELINQRKELSFSSEEVLRTTETKEPVLNPELFNQSTAPKQPTEVQGHLDTDNPERIVYRNGQLTATVWGGIEKENLSRLKVSLHFKLSTGKGPSFRDDVNLYGHVAVKKLIQNLSETLEINSAQATAALADLTEKLEAYRMGERAAIVQSLKPKTYEMTDKEARAAQSFLQSPELVKKTLQLIGQSGLIGEQKNGLLLFFLYLSRYFDEPLHAIIFGKSGSGKTYLQTKVSECLPEESVRTITSLTENTLYYSGRDFWKHKVLLIEDLDGVYNAFLPLREFMSKQSITKLTTDKDAKGNNVQKVLTVEGPICVSGATTKEGIYEDNANRSYLLHINEGADHTEEVMDYQRKLQAGLVDEASQVIAKQILQNAQRLIQPVKIINPYAIQLKIPDSVFKKLRTNMHYLRLIETITFWHQYQRERKKDGKGKEYIETTIEDISWANRLVKESLLSKSDELNGQLRSFFESLKTLMDKKEEGQRQFYAKQIREQFRMNPMRTNRYLRELEMWGYLKQTGGNRKTGFEYEITAWDEYKMLQSGIDILDGILQKLKEGKKSKTEL